MTRGALVLVALLSLLAVTGAGAARPSKWPPPDCPTTRALVAFYFTNEFTFNDDLVVRRDRHASLCWGRAIRRRSGRVDFVVSLATMKALTLQLQRLGSLGPPLPPPTPVRADVPSASLVYRGTTIPSGAYPSTPAGIRAFRRAKALLNGIIAAHLPRQ